MIRVLFVCHGNICRSTMAQSVLTDMVEKRGISSGFYIESAATSREEIGNPPHRGTREKLRKEGIPLVPHKAIQMTRGDYRYYDYLIGMDSENIYYMNRIAGGDPAHKIYKLLSFAGFDSDVADPWYTDNFDVTYVDVVQGCRAFLKYLGYE
ncbi:MAG: low molecular weight phosphotyrosine protein phosphatase [Lachnospiraceae bacterium]|nr:low molecular weight phosphotyrosine protein phosphatase [Lachnospiraceae bacterium]